MSKRLIDIDEIDDAWEGFARRLKSAREAKGWSQEDLGRAVGMGQSKISDIETMGSNPSLATVLRLAAGLGISAHQLFADDSGA